MCRWHILAGVLPAFFLQSLLHAAPGDFDTGFGGGTGWVSTGFLEDSSAVGMDVIRQADGKLVVASYSFNGNDRDFALLRYNNNGSLDTSFSGDGLLTTAIGSGDDAAYAVIQQTDGKLVVAGSSCTSCGSSLFADRSDFALLRYNSDGTLDTSFGVGGKVTTNVAAYLSPLNGSPNTGDVARSVIQQADGKLVVAGFTQDHYSQSSEFALVRYNSNGSLDTSFSEDGVLSTLVEEPFVPSPGTELNSTCRAYSVIQQLDGKLVVAGSSFRGSYTGDNSHDFALVRYNSDGSLDNTFDTDGKVTTKVSSQWDDYAVSVIQQADGRLVAVGFMYNSLMPDDEDLALTRYKGSAKSEGLALVRYNSNGSLDTSFSGDGKVTAKIGIASEARSVIQQTDGKLVVAGYSDNGNDSDFALLRYNSNGLLDTGFNGDGILTTAIDTRDDVAFAVIQQTDDKLSVAGYSDNGSTRNVVLARYNSNGSPDISFSGDGKNITSYRYSAETARSTIQQTDGKLVVAGYSGVIGNVDFVLARYNSNGSLDSSFDGDGKVTTAIGARDDAAYSVIQQADGKLVVAGYSDNGSNKDFALVRYNSNGSLDSSFSGDGVLTAAIGARDDVAYAVVQQVDGKLVVAGSSCSSNCDDYIAGNHNFALVRYNSNGTLDTSFDGDGVLTTEIGSIADVAYSVVQQADGKLVVAGSSCSSGCDDHFTQNDDFALVRYNSNGALDTSFDGDGKLITAIGMGDDVAYSVIQQADGKLVVGGYSYNGSAKSFALVRYNGNGSLDSSFDDDGKVTTAIGASGDVAYSVIQQADGKLVVAGYSLDDGGYRHFVLARYKQDGVLDATFSGDGVLVTVMGMGSSSAYSVIEQADGKLVVAGDADGMPTGREFVVARYESGQLDTDGDNLVDWLDTDNDGDGVLNGADTLPLDTDNDGIANSVDTEDDGDGVADVSDNCALMSNANQLDTDSDGAGNACDSDDDDDSVVDSVDAFPLDGAESADTDSDSVGNNVDTDDDNDGLVDANDNCPLLVNADQLDFDTDGTGDVCGDAAPMPEDVFGAAAKDYAGKAVAFVGDFNGDGYGDYAIGMPGYDVPATATSKVITDVGRVQVVSGLDGTVLADWIGEQGKGGAGSAVAGGRDVNDDGYADVVVGAPLDDDIVNALQDAGSVTVLYGPTGAQADVYYGAQSKAKLGSSVAIGDVDGDGSAEVMAGGVASVNVFSAVDGSVFSTFVGTTVATGDTNGDGGDEIIVGSVAGNGTVTVYTQAGAVLAQRVGAVLNAQFGKSLASGDINHDGFDDVIVGAPWDDDLAVGLKDAGSVTVLSGEDGSELAKHYGTTAKANLGSSVAVGDVDNDGIADLIAGGWKDDRPGDPLTKDAGSVTVWSGATGTVIVTRYGAAAKDSYGFACAAGDVNSDGYTDIIIGAYTADVPGASKLVKDIGKVVVMSGKSF